VFRTSKVGIVGADSSTLTLTSIPSLSRSNKEQLVCCGLQLMKIVELKSGDGHVLQTMAHTTSRVADNGTHYLSCCRQWLILPHVTRGFLADSTDALQAAF